MSSAQVVPVERAEQDRAAERIAAAEAAVARFEAEAEAVEVRTIEEARAAQQIAANLAAEEKRLEAERVELVKPLKDYTKGIDEKYKLAKAPLKAAISKLKTKIIGFNEEAERKRRAEQRKLDEERESREEEIRKRREAEEAAAREKQRKAEQEQREAEDLAAKDPEMAELVEESRDAAREAKTHADVISSLPEPSIPLATLAPQQKVEGAAPTKRWDFEVADLEVLPAYLPDGEPLIEVRSGPLRRYMHAYIKEHGHPPEMAGVEFKQVDGLAVRD